MKTLKSKRLVTNLICLKMSKDQPKEYHPETEEEYQDRKWREYEEFKRIVDEHKRKKDREQ